MSSRGGMLLLVVLLAAGAAALLSAAPTHAAGVTQPLYLEQQVSGSPTGTWTVTGCSIAATPLPDDDSLVSISITAALPCTLTVTAPAPTTTTQYVTTSSATSYTVNVPATCTSTCTADHHDDWYQDKITVSYSVTDGGSPTAPILKGTSLGVSTNIATLTATPTSYWVDADSGCSVTNPAAGSSTAERWDTKKSCVVSAGRSTDFNYYNQFYLNVVGGNSVVLTLTQFGVPASTSPPNWADAGTIATVSTFGVWGRGDGTGERVASWNLDGGTNTAVLTTGKLTTTAITMSATHVVNFNAVTQYEVTLNAGATSMLESLTGPTVPGDNYWYDAGTPVTLVLYGINDRVDGVGLRVASYTVNSGTTVTEVTLGQITILNSVAISTGESVVANVVNQYLLTLDSGAINALNSLTPPTLVGDANWYDSGTNVSFAGNGVYGRASGTGFRVSSFTLDSGSSTPVLTTGVYYINITMVAPHSIHTQTVVQYEVSLSGPNIVAYATSPTIPSDDYWYDSGTSVSFTLAGVFQRIDGAGERLASYSVDGGASVKVASAANVSVLSSISIGAPVSISFTTTQQFQLTLNAAATEALNTVTPPTLSGDAYWYDLGTRVTVTLNGIWGRNATAGERLVSYSYNGGQANPVATLGTVNVLVVPSITTPESVSATVATQYLLTVTGVSSASYSPPPPIPSDSIWFDSGTSVKVSTNSTFGSNGSTRERVSGWSLDGGAVNAVSPSGAATTSAIVMDGPHAVSFSLTTQYNVMVTVKDSSGQHTLAPQTITLLVNGASQNAVKGSVWVDNGSTVAVQSVIWAGLQVSPGQSAPQTVTFPVALTVDAKVYATSVVVKDVLGFPVGGAVVTVTFANNTSTALLTQGNGTANLGMVPLGTYSGTVSYNGLSNSFTGNAAVQSVTSVTVYLSDAVLGTIIIVVVALAIVIVEVVHRRRESSKSDRFTQASVESTSAQ